MRKIALFIILNPIYNISTSCLAILPFDFCCTDHGGLVHALLTDMERESLVLEEWIGRKMLKDNKVGSERQTKVCFSFISKSEISKTCTNTILAISSLNPVLMSSLSSTSKSSRNCSASSSFSLTTVAICSLETNWER